MERLNGYMRHPSPLVDSSLAPVYVEKNLGEDAYRGLSMEERLSLSVSFWTTLDHRVAWVADLTEIQTSTAAGRQKYAEFQARVDPYQYRLLDALAIVAPSHRQQGIVKAVEWQRKAPPPYTIRLFDDPAGAIAWARELVGQPERSGRE